MRATSESPVATTFDPFGEPVVGGVGGACTSGACTGDAGDRTARRIGGAVFWSLALLILAGRVYAYDGPLVAQVAAYAAQVVATR